MTMQQLCQISQRTNLKANHNMGGSLLVENVIPYVVPNIAKNKSESKSQLDICHFFLWNVGVVPNIAGNKSTKANHNILVDSL